MKLYEFSSGDTAHKYKKSIVILFKGKRHVLSTGPNNGGFTTDLSAVFNNDANPGSGMEIKLRADSYRKHMDILAEEDLGLDPASCSGLMTAASMENAAISTLSYEDFSVTSIATAGVRSNGGRIGDPASWHEKSENSFEDTTASIGTPIKTSIGTSIETSSGDPTENKNKHKRKHIFDYFKSEKTSDKTEANEIPAGTINILLYIDANLEKEAMASSLVSCAEAKAAAMQELLIPSRYSCGIATGTGTDGVIVISNAESKTRLTNAGKHSKLGELIGRTVMSSIKEALKLQQGITPESQHDIIQRMERFGVSEDALWDCYKETYRNLIRAEFTDILDRIRTDNTLVTYSSLYAHLLDQLSWGLLSFAECRVAANELLKLADLHTDSESGTENIIENYIFAIAERIHRESVHS